MFGFGLDGKNLLGWLEQSFRRWYAVLYFNGINRFIRRTAVLGRFIDCNYRSGMHYWFQRFSMGELWLSFQAPPISTVLVSKRKIQHYVWCLLSVKSNWIGKQCPADWAVVLAIRIQHLINFKTENRNFSNYKTKSIPSFGCLCFPKVFAVFNALVDSFA